MSFTNVSSVPITPPPPDAAAAAATATTTGVDDDDYYQLLVPPPRRFVPEPAVKQLSPSISGAEDRPSESPSPPSRQRHCRTGPSESRQGVIRFRISRHTLYSSWSILVNGCDRSPAVMKAHFP